MPCKELQTKIAVHERLTPEEIRHAESCPECADFATFDATLGARLADWRAIEAVPRRRVASVQPFRLAYAGLGLAAVLTLVAVSLPTRSTAQDAYRQMLGEVRQVRTVHLVVNWRPGNGSPEDGPLRKRYELWWRPGTWREQWAGMQPSLKRVEKEGLMFYRYDPGVGGIQRAHESAAQPDFRTFDLASFATQYMDPPTRIDHPSANQIVAINKGGGSRIVFTLDPATGLPKHAQKQFLRGVTWLTSGELDMRFNEAIPDSRFTPEDLRPVLRP